MNQQIKRQAAPCPEPKHSDVVTSQGGYCENTVEIESTVLYCSTESTVEMFSPQLASQELS